MIKSVVIVGLGEMGSVFARGFLRAGYSVQPVIRGVAMQAVAEEVADPELVLIAVAETDLHEQLAKLPVIWRDRLVLLQNELLPRDWQQYGLEPTVISVWFEKKKGMDSKVIIPSPVYGRHARPVADALAAIDIPTTILASEAALLHELVLKNIFILTTNIAGLQVGGNVEQLWSNHNAAAYDVAADVITLQEALTGQTLNHRALIDGMVKAFQGDPEHVCMGRSAAARLQRALMLAAEYGLSLKTLEKVSRLKSCQ
jgi:ketopantoate reductase